MRILLNFDSPYQTIPAFGGSSSIRNQFHPPTWISQKQRKAKSASARRSRNLFGGVRGIIGIGLILIVISRAAGLVLPWSSKVLMDDVVDKKNLDLLTYLLIAVVVSLLVQAVTSFLLTKLLSVEAQRLISQLRSKVQRHILSLPSATLTIPSPALVSRIMSDVEGVRNLVGTGLVQLIRWYAHGDCFPLVPDQHQSLDDLDGVGSGGHFCGDCHARFRENKAHF